MGRYMGIPEKLLIAFFLIISLSDNVPAETESIRSIVCQGEQTFQVDSVKRQLVPFHQSAKNQAFRLKLPDIRDASVLKNGNLAVLSGNRIHEFSRYDRKWIRNFNLRVKDIITFTHYNEYYYISDGNMIYILDSSGTIGKVVPESDGIRQITYYKDYLWVMDRSNNLVQLDPVDGKKQFVYQTGNSKISDFCLGEDYLKYIEKGKDLFEQKFFKVGQHFVSTGESVNEANLDIECDNPGVGLHRLIVMAPPETEYQKIISFQIKDRLFKKFQYGSRNAYFKSLMPEEDQNVKISLNIKWKQSHASWLVGQIAPKENILAGEYRKPVTLKLREGFTAFLEGSRDPEGFLNYGLPLKYILRYDPETGAGEKLFAVNFGSQWVPVSASYGMNEIKTYSANNEMKFLDLTHSMNYLPVSSPVYFMNEKNRLENMECRLTKAGL